MKTEVVQSIPELINALAAGDTSLITRLNDLSWNLQNWLRTGAVSEEVVNTTLNGGCWSELSAEGRTFFGKWLQWMEDGHPQLQ